MILETLIRSFVSFVECSLVGDGMVLQGFRSLKVYQLSYELALEIFLESKAFPPEERYDLTSQLRRSSRSVPRNISEAWRRRVYPKAFFQKLVDASAEASETEVSIDMCRDFGYITTDRHNFFICRYEEVQRMLSGMMDHPERFHASRRPPSS